MNEAFELSIPSLHRVEFILNVVLSIMVKITVPSFYHGKWLHTAIVIIFFTLLVEIAFAIKILKKIVSRLTAHVDNTILFYRLRKSIQGIFRAFLSM